MQSIKAYISNLPGLPNAELTNNRVCFFRVGENLKLGVQFASAPFRQLLGVKLVDWGAIVRRRKLAQVAENNEARRF